ncbi:hypothetical protein INR49_015581 [Caranx melampygus]|nr:hypothetical protein INR49_015581 [Caranx melampygus]
MATPRKGSLWGLSEEGSWTGGAFPSSDGRMPAECRDAGVNDTRPPGRKKAEQQQVQVYGGPWMRPKGKLQALKSADEWMPC